MSGLRFSSLHGQWDASHQRFETVLMQKGKVITYVFCQLKNYKDKYLTHYLELAAVIFALKIWHHYLYEVKTNVYTNHKSLKYFFT